MNLHRVSLDGRDDRRRILVFGASGSLVGTQGDSNETDRPTSLSDDLPPERGGAVRLAPPLRTGAARRSAPSASALLGRDHPLVRVHDALTVAGSQSLVVAAVLVTSLSAAAAGEAPWAPAVTVSAAVVLVALGVAAALLRQRRRDDVLALIAAGREELPLVLVQRERRRLLDARTRLCLASSLERLVEEARTAPFIRMPPLFDRRVGAAVAGELLEVASLLRAEPSNAHGVALVWRLISDGLGSPLYGSELADLRRELGRIRFLLNDAALEPEETAR